MEIIKCRCGGVLTVVSPPAPDLLIADDYCQVAPGKTLFCRRCKQTYRDGTCFYYSPHHGGSYEFIRTHHSTPVCG